MDKRLTRTDYLFALMFIFMLVCILGAFFYGLRIGQEKSDQKYEKILHADQETVQEPGAYDQQLLVSFYHTIYLPFREFQNKWFELTNQIEFQSSTLDASAALNEAAKLADEKYQLLQGKTMPASSPLLQQAHQGFLKSMKLFADTLKNFKPRANSIPGNELIDAMAEDAFLIEAKKQALIAQKDYYDSIIKWQQSVDVSFKPFDTSKEATIDEWRQMNLNMKNLYVSVLLSDNQTFVPYYPQDATIRIDDFIGTGQASKLAATTVKQTFELLKSTDAVRPGDFVKGKHKRYSNELLPQLPFFLDAN